jgi:hypothetical protein
VSLYFNALRYQIAGNYADRQQSPGGDWHRISARSSTFGTETQIFNELPNPVPLPKELAGLRFS